MARARRDGAMALLRDARRNSTVTEHSAVWTSELNGFRMAGEYSPAYGVGGDIFNFAPTDRPNTLNAVIGDVCGRGLPAAELVNSVRPEFDRAMRSLASPARLMAALNEVVVRRFPDHAFLTAAWLRLDAGAGVVTLVNAGHVPAILRQADGHARVVGQPSGPPLGMLPGAEYHEERQALSRGDIIILMTDGVLEAVEQDLVSMRKLLSLTSRAPRDPAAINDLIFAEVHRSVRTPDDLTIFSVECCGEAGSRVIRSRSRTLPGEMNPVLEETS